MQQDTAVEILVFTRDDNYFSMMAQSIQEVLESSGGCRVRRVRQRGEVYADSIVVVDLMADHHAFVSGLSDLRLKCLLAFADLGSSGSVRAFSEGDARTHESSASQELLAQLMGATWADGWWLAPFRAPDLIGALRAGSLLRKARVVARSELAEGGLESLKQSLELASKLQRERFQSRLEDMGGFFLKSRYLAGNRAGGNYFEASESTDGRVIHLVATDSSSYGLSSQVLNLVFRMCTQLSQRVDLGPQALLSLFRNEILGLLSPTDQLSLFIASIARSDLRMRYLQLGFGEVRYRGGGTGEWQRVDLPGTSALSRAKFEIPHKEGVLNLQPGGRLLILSSGFHEVVSGDDWNSELTRQDPKGLLTELTYRIRKRCGQSGEELPPRDCTAIVLDVDKKAIRLAS